MALLLLLVTLAGVASSASSADALRRPRCALDRFVVDGPALLPGGSSPAVLEFVGQRLAIPGSCEPTRAYVRQRRRDIVVRARWSRCRDASRVRIRATVDPETCLIMSGVLWAKEPPLGRSFTATAANALQVLVFSRTAGFRHPSIADAHRVLGALPPAEGIVTTITEDPAVFTDANLARFDVVMFVNTTGDVLDESQQAAMERFVRAGGGWVGVHSAADTEYGWPWYGRLVGAYFASHPILPLEVTVTTEDGTHPSTTHLPARFQFNDEWYNFDRNPRTDNVILLTIDEAGFTLPNFPFGRPSMGADHPVAWYKEFDGGRSFYTNLGHRPETWDDPLFMRHLLAGIRWAASHLTYNRIVLTGEARNPMALAVAPDGSVFYIERTGEVRLWTPATGRVIEAARLEVDTAFENGLLGIALDPAFAQNRLLYLYHSAPVADPPPAGPPGRNTLSRFVVRSDGTLDLGSRVDLLAVPSERLCCHEGGSLAFGPDGTLFLSTGDNTNPFAGFTGTAPLDERPGREQFNSQRTAANPFDLRGKILRIRPDGTIPPGNMFPPSGELGRPEIYVMGCRNPFRIALDPISGRLFWGDVGPDAFTDRPRGPRGHDEINLADGPGNYGWPYCIGPNLPYADFDYETQTLGPLFSCEGLTPALLAYDYNSVSYLALGSGTTENGFVGRTAIAGVVYRRPPGPAPYALPAPFADTLLMTDWTRDVIASVAVNEAGALLDVKRFLPFERLLRPIDLDVGPDGALYVLEYGSGYSGDNPDARLSRVEYSEAGDLTPVAVITASPTAGQAPLQVALSAEGSRTPGRNDRIARYEWDVDGDGVVDATDPSIVHTFSQNGRFAVTLVVAGTSGRRSFPAVAEVVVGNTPPQVTIRSPADGTVVPEGSVVTLVGEVTDAEDGTPPCERLLWDIRLGHNAHAHPTTTREGCTATFQAALADHEHHSGIFYAVELSYTDNGGPGGEPALTGRQGIRIDIGE
jgi:glucose/arabinose dehydrogenase/type 1 glutamine amidotransferase